MPNAIYKTMTNENTFVLPFFDEADIALAEKMPSVRFLCDTVKELSPDIAKLSRIYDPNETFRFLHECALIEFKGTLYASWYNNPQTELHGYTPICEMRSCDGGKTWSAMEIVVHDETNKLLYCPPVYAIDGGKLYMILNEMVGADLISALDLYVLNEETDRFELLWSRPLPLKVNTNAVTLSNGKLLLPGRLAELDGFPRTPAVLISDSGKIDAEWRLVKLQADGYLPDGTQLLHPELSVIEEAGTLYMFCRNDERRVPLVYISKDMGESWSVATGHDIPYISSKIYTGTLKDGRHYLIANIDDYSRRRLALYFSEKGSVTFNRRLVLDGEKDGISFERLHYPSACEVDGKLYVIVSIDYKGEGRGSALLTVDLSKI